MLVLDAHSTDQENAFELCTNRKYRIWWCSILHEVHFFLIIPQWNSGWHEIIKHVQLCVCVCVCTYVCVYEAWSESIWTDAVKLTKLNLPSGWTNPLQSRPHLLGYNYSSGLSAAGRTSHSLFWRHVRVFLTQRIGTKSHRAMSVEYKGWCTCGMWCLFENCCVTISRHGMNFCSSCLMPTSLDNTLPSAHAEMRDCSPMRCW